MTGKKLLFTVLEGVFVFFFRGSAPSEAQVSGGPRGREGDNERRPSIISHTTGKIHHRTRQWRGWQNQEAMRSCTTR